MATLKTLRARIKSVKQTQKITSAMKMIASARLKKVQMQAEMGRSYDTLLMTCLESLKGMSQEYDFTTPILNTGHVQSTRTLVVSVTADRGLCGGFNSNLIKTTKRVIAESQGKVDLIAVGKKSCEAFKHETIKAYKDWTQISDLLTFAKTISGDIFQIMRTTNYQTILMVSAHFKNVIQQDFVINTLMPIQKKTRQIKKKPAEIIKNKDTMLKSLYFLDQPYGELLTSLTEQAFTNSIYQALLETKACEQAARMTAMDQATRNADDMIKKLELTYNRSRQATITRELIEILSGAAALRA